MSKSEVIEVIRKLEGSIIRRRYVQAVTIGVSMFVLLLYAIFEMSEYSWLIVGAMLVILVTHDLVATRTNTHRVHCVSCGYELVLGVQSNYLLLENRCPQCTGKIYET